jgi:hypothetical protein
MFVSLVEVADRVVIEPDVATRVFLRLPILLILPVASSLYFSVHSKQAMPLVQEALPSPTYAKTSPSLAAPVILRHSIEFVMPVGLFGAR